MTVRLEMMQGPLTDAVIEALEATNEKVSCEETNGGMVLITGEDGLTLTRGALCEAYGDEVSVESLNTVTVAIVGRTAHWGSDGFSIVED